MRTLSSCYTVSSVFGVGKTKLAKNPDLAANEIFVYPLAAKENWSSNGKEITDFLISHYIYLQPKKSTISNVLKPLSVKQIPPF